MRWGLIYWLAAMAAYPARTMAEPIFVVSADGWLSNLEQESGEVVRIGRTANAYDDLAAFNGRIYGIGNERLFEVRPTDGQVRHIGNFTLDQPLPFFGAAAKGFAISLEGVGYITADEFPTSGLYSIDLITAATRRISTLNFDSPRGDIVFGAAGELLATACVETGLLRECNDSRADLLYTINPTSGQAALVGSIMDQTGEIVTGLDALAMADGTLVGITGRGEIYSIDTTDASAIHLGATQPRVLATGAAAFGDAGLPPVQRIETHLPNLSQVAENLVLVTHGWTGPLDSEPTWVNEMAAAIDRRLNNTWQAIPYLWDEQGLASGGMDDLQHILRDGMNLGWLDGGVIGKRGFDHVTIIASSAGSGLAAAMLDSIQALSPQTTTELIYLDPVMPNHSHLATFGEDVTYGVNYFVSDITTGEQTEQELLLHNVNLDNFKTFLDLITGHSRPREWFMDTIIAANPDPGWQGYGWPITKAGTAAEDTWPPAEMPMNNGVIMLPETAGTGQPIKILTLQERNYLFGNGQLTGNTQASETLLILRADPFDRAVASFSIEPSIPYNLIEVQVDFESIEAEGLLTVSLNDERWRIDERNFGDGARIFQLPLEGAVTAERQLTIRLDAFNNVSSQAAINSLKLHLVERISLGEGLLAGDANRNFAFDRLDLVQVLQAAKYLSGLAATWGEGDWNGDGLFDPKDITAALQTGKYGTGPYAAVPEPTGWILFLCAIVAFWIMCPRTRIRDAKY